MCNRYEEQMAWDAYVQEMARSPFPLDLVDAQGNFEPKPDIRPTNPARILRAKDPANPAGGLELVERRWGFVPWFHKGDLKALKGPGTNARWETIDTTPMYRDAYRARRCVIPASAYFEWTGAKSPKTRWRFSRADGRPLWFPGVWGSWKGPDGAVLESFSMMTCAAGMDAANYHDRQPVVMEVEQIGEWLDLAGPGKGAFGPSPAGLIEVAYFDGPKVEAPTFRAAAARR